MKYHDYHLRGYSVENFGTRIVLDLVYDYPGTDKQESKIEFSDVACYFFQHTTGAIITDIEKFDVATLVKEEEQLLMSFARQYGLKYWNKDISDYVDTLQKEQFSGWRIQSAIGFDGFVIAQAINGSSSLGEVREAQHRARRIPPTNTWWVTRRNR